MKPAMHSDATASGLSRDTAGAAAVRGLKVLCALLITGLLLAGLASLAASLVPFSVLLARVRSVSDSGQGTFFSPEFYRAMQTRLRLIGIANLATGITLLSLRRQMYKWAVRVFTDTLILARDFCLAARSLPGIDRLALAGLTFFAAALRIPLLTQPMRYDEAITFVEYASRPFYVALSFYNTPNNHVFHTLLVRLAYLALGNHPWVLRLPALLAGLFLVPTTYAAARSLYGNRSALLAAALVASSSMLIEDSTNARGYEIVCLLFMIMIPAGGYALRFRNWAAWLLLAVVSALGFYTIPIMLYPFGGLVVWLLLSIAVGDAQPEGRCARRRPIRRPQRPVWTFRCDFIDDAAGRGTLQSGAGGLRTKGAVRQQVGVGQSISYIAPSTSRVAGLHVARLEPRPANVAGGGAGRGFRDLVAMAPANQFAARAARTRVAAVRGAVGVDAARDSF